MTANVIASKPPNDGNEWDCQCARCGSTLMFDPCPLCAGEGFTEHDCGEDTCCCAEPDNNVACSSCGGSGSFPTCLSSDAFCEAHPLNGREETERSTIEWFVVRVAEASRAERSERV